MKTRGSAYILVLIMTTSMLLMLAIAANTTNYQVKVSKAYGKYSSLSLMASLGVERAVYAINSSLDEKRAQISQAAAASMTDDSEYIPLFLEEADSIIKAQFANTEIAYSLTLTGDESYNVSVIITDAGSGLHLKATAVRDGFDGAEAVTAVAVCSADAEFRTDESGTHIVTGDIVYTIEALKQNR